MAKRRSAGEIRVADQGRIFARFTNGFEILVALPEQRRQMREALVARYFPWAADALLDGSPIPNQDSTPAAAEDSPDYGRSPAFRRSILKIYDHQCAACSLHLRPSAFALRVYGVTCRPSCSVLSFQVSAFRFQVSGFRFPSFVLRPSSFAPRHPPFKRGAGAERTCRKNVAPAQGSGLLSGSRRARMAGAEPCRLKPMIVSPNTPPAES